MNFQRFGVAMACGVSLLTLPVPVLAIVHLVTFDPITGGPWGVGWGNAPGDLIFTEDAVDVRIQQFFDGTYWFLNTAAVTAPLTDFGQGQILTLNNITAEFDFSGVPGPCPVQFQFADLLGPAYENIRVNGGPLYYGQLQAMSGGTMAPGVVLYTADVPGPISGGFKSVAILDGPVDDLWLGGPALFLDNVALICSPPPCDHVVTHETQAMDTRYGSCDIHAPGDLAFSEDGIDVFLEEYMEAGGPWTFTCAEIDPPIVYFGQLHTLRLNNISVVYDFSGLSGEVASVRFGVGDIGGDEDFQVNGSTFYVGELETAVPPSPAPGVLFSINTVPIYGGQREEILLEGSVETLLLGGQELWVDNICVEFDTTDSGIDRQAAAGLKGESCIATVGPNPMAPRTTVEYRLAAAAPVRIEIFDVRGSRVRVLLDEEQPAGVHTIDWDGTGEDRRPVNGGAYFLRLTAGQEVLTRRILQVH